MGEGGWGVGVGGWLGILKIKSTKSILFELGLWVTENKLSRVGGWVGGGWWGWGWVVGVSENKANSA